MNLKNFSIIGFLKGLYFYIPILALFLIGNDVSLAAIVICQTFYSLFNFIGEVPTGIFADYVGQKNSIIIGYLLEGLGILFILLFPTALGLYVAYSIRGLANAFLSGSEEALIFESAKHEGNKNYQKEFGRFLANEQVGFIISTALAGLVYQYWGAESFAPLIILSAVLHACTAIAALFLKNYKTEVFTSEGSRFFSILKESFGLIRKDTVILTLTIVTVLTLSGEYFLQGVYQPYFQLSSVTPIWFGLALSLGTLVRVIVLRYAYLLENHFSVEKILVVLNLALAACYILMGVFINPILAVGSFMILTGFFSLQTPIISDYINVRTSSSIRTTVLSGVSFIKRFFQMFIMWGLGAIVGLHSVQSAFIFQAVYLTIGLVIGYFLLVRCGCTYKIKRTQLP